MKHYEVDMKLVDAIVARAKGMLTHLDDPKLSEYVIAYARRYRVNLQDFLDLPFEDGSGRQQWKGFFTKIYKIYWAGKAQEK